MTDRYKSRKQRIKFQLGRLKTARKEKERRQTLHIINPLTGRGEWRGLKAA